MRSQTARLERAEKQLRTQSATTTWAALSPIQLAEAAGLAPDPWQARVFRSTSPRLLMNCARQLGKSEVAAVLATHTALCQPDSLCLLLSPSLRQSAELFRKCLGVYRVAADPVPPEAETKLALELANGSRIVSLPGSEQTVRGFSAVRLLVIDEAARIPDDLIAAVRPMLAVSGGRLVALSTPWGRRGWFFRTWQAGEGWERVRVTAAECPRIPAAFLEAERQALTALEYASEYECSFEDVLGAAFAEEDIRATLDDPTVLPLFGGGHALY